MMARAFNSLEGFTIKDDQLPRRLFDPKPDGPRAGETIFTEKEFQKGIEMLYDVIGCHPETGRPSRGKLIELGLDWVEDLLKERQGL
jgi:aldehyde:ferredoxin oxidoreductase